MAYTSTNTLDDFSRSALVLVLVTTYILTNSAQQNLVNFSYTYKSLINKLDNTKTQVKAHYSTAFF